MANGDVPTSADRSEYQKRKEAAQNRATASEYGPPMGGGYYGSSTASAASNRGQVAMGTPIVENLQSWPKGAAKPGMYTYYSQYYHYVPVTTATGGNLVNTLPRWQWDLFNAVAQSRGGLSNVNSVFDEYAARSSYETGFGRNLSPTDLLLADLADGRVALGEDQSGGGGGYSYGGGGGGYGGGGGGGSVSLTNPTSARGLLMQTMQSVLGRNPTNDEYKTFLQVLNEAEMANPNTASFEGGMAVGSGGVDPGVLALEFAQDQEDFTERQGDRYFRTFMQALAGGV